MKRLVLAAILAAGILNATDFSSMSTEELVSLKGTVATEKKAAFRKEIQNRISSMTAKEKEELGITTGSSGQKLGTKTKDRSVGSGMSTSIDGMGNGMGGFGGGNAGGGMGGGGRR